MRRHGRRPVVEQGDLRARTNVGERVANTVGDRGHHLSNGRHALAGHELMLDGPQLFVRRRQLLRMALQRTALAGDAPGGSADDPEQAQVERGTAHDRRGEHGHLSPSDVGEDTNRLLVRLHDPDDGSAFTEDDGNVDLHEALPLRLVYVLALLVHLEVDRSATGQRSAQLGIVAEDLAEEAWLVGPHDSHAGVIDLHAHDLGHDDGALVEEEKPLLRRWVPGLREVGSSQVVNRFRPNEVGRRAPLPVEQVVLEGVRDDEAERRGDQPDDDETEYPELTGQCDVPPPSE